MPIVDSRISDDAIQADGRRSVREIHIDENGAEYVIEYMAEADFDADSAMKQRIEELNAEIEALANRPPPEKVFTETQVKTAFATVEGKGEKVTADILIAEAAKVEVKVDVIALDVAVVEDK